MGEDYSNRKLQNASFRSKDLSNSRFVNADVRGVDFSNSNLSGADFTNAKTGISEINTFFIFLGTLVVSAFSGYIAMLAGRTIEGMLESADEGIRFAGEVSIVVIILFIAFSYWRGVGNTISHLVIPVSILALAIGSAAYFSGLGTGLGALYLTLALLLVSAMFVIGTIARVSAGTLSNILFIIVALMGGIFGRTVGGGLGTVVLAISCALVSKRALAGAKGFGSLRKAAFFFTRKFGTSFRHANLVNANFAGSTLHNSDFSNAELSAVNWGNSEKINCIINDEDPEWSKKKT